MKKKEKVKEFPIEELEGVVMDFREVFKRKFKEGKYKEKDK